MSIWGYFVWNFMHTVEWGAGLALWLERKVSEATRNEWKLSERRGSLREGGGLVMTKSWISWPACLEGQCCCCSEAIERWKYLKIHVFSTWRRCVVRNEVVFRELGQHGFPKINNHSTCKMLNYCNVGLIILLSLKLAQLLILSERVKVRRTELLMTDTGLTQRSW